MTVEEIRNSEQYKEEKKNIKRHGGFNLIGQYRKTDAQIEQWLMDAVRATEIHLQALKDMLEERDFH